VTCRLPRQNDECTRYQHIAYRPESTLAEEVMDLLGYGPIVLGRR